jgi:hypothetical protein
MAIRNYSPSDVSVLLAGFYQIDGFVSGSFLTITKDVQPYKTTRTADGTIARTFIRDDSYTITLTLASTSPTNDILSNIVLVDSLTQYAKFPMFVKDTLGTSLFLAPTCWVKQVPEMSFSDEISDRVWVIQASQCVTNFGGNEDASGALQDLATISLGAAASTFL